MRIILIVFFIIANTESLFSQEFKNSNEKWNQLMELVNNEIQTIKNNQYSSVELKHRLFELYSEKLKLTKENETQEFLKQDPKSSAKRGKETFFKISSSHFLKSQQFALQLISENPRYQRINEIYYTLALNSRDYGTGEETEKFLKLAIKFSKENELTLYDSQVALAEYYYNNKNYNESIHYYNDILKNTQNEWYGKHLYNASWCLLKERNFRKALELMIRSFETTKNNRYISMRDQILNAIGIFYVQADSTKDAIVFFEKNITPSSPFLLMLAKSSMNKNNFSETEDVLRAALRDSQNKKDSLAEMKVRIVQLDIYRESKHDEKYFDTANKIFDFSKKNKIDQNDLSAAVNKIKEVTGFMQVNLIKDKNENLPRYNKDDYKKIMRYFDILSSLDKSSKNMYRYFQGETALSVHDYQTALKYYVRSVISSKKNDKATDIAKKAIDSILSTLEVDKFKQEKKLDKKQQDEYSIFALKNLVLIYPRSEKAQMAYQKLFNKYHEIFHIKKAVNILLVYEFYYPEDAQIHREMLSLILDVYILKKQVNKLAFWIQKIEKGHLQFPSNYIQKTIAILGGLLFDKYQMLEKQGNIKEAMKGYESIYESKKYPMRTKAEAAYAIAALYLEQNHAQNSYSWLKNALEIYDNKDLIKIVHSLLGLAKGYRLLQNFDLSSELANSIIKRFCKQDFPEKGSLYELDLINIAMSELSSKRILKREEQYSDCNFDRRVIENTQLNLFQHLLFLENQSEIYLYFIAHSNNDKLVRQMERYLKARFWQASESQKAAITIEIKNLIHSHPSTPLLEMLNHYEKVSFFRKKVFSTKFDFSSPLLFDEIKFNSELEQYFSIISELASEASELSKSSTTEEVGLIREVLSTPYFRLASAITTYTPKGVEKKYLEGFRLGMRQITESLTSKGLQIDREKNLFFAKNNIFNENQKNDTFAQKENDESNKAESTLQKTLDFHTAILFSNTMDLVKGQ